MSTTTISMTEAKKRLGEVVNRVSYGGERIVLLSRGRPRAALVSIEDLDLIRQALDDGNERELRTARRQAWLARADTLREQIAARVGGPLPDSVEELRELREERTNELAGLR